MLIRRVKLRLEQLRLEQLRLEQLRLEQLRLEQLRFEPLRLEQRRRSVLPPFRLALALALGLVLGATGGCGSDSLKPRPPVDSSALAWTLELNHRAVLLSTAAPYDTLTLVATPRNVYGEALTGLPHPTYTSADPNRVSISPDGVLRAVAPMAPGSVVQIAATLQDTADNVTYVDYALVSVVSADAAPAVASFSLHPVPPDSAKVGASVNGNTLVSDTLPLRVIDTAGAPILATGSGGILPIDIHIADSSIVGFSNSNDRNVIYGRQPGTTEVYASTTVLGVTWADTIDYRVGWPVFAPMLVNLTGAGGTGLGGPITPTLTPTFFSLPEIRLGTGGIVMWIHPNAFVTSFDTTTQVDVRFADAVVSQVAPIPSPLPGFLIWTFYCSFPGFSDCANSGNFAIGGHTGNHVAMRSFPVPGTYDYSSPAYPGSHGRIVVVDER